MSTHTPRAAQSNANAIFISSAYFGGGAAALGGTFAAFYATVKGRNTVLWTGAAGAQCFVLGSTFWFSRTVLRNNALEAHPLSPKEELMYSSLAGSFAGMAGGALRGRGNIIPGAIVVGLMGLGGQASYTVFEHMAEKPADSRPLLDRLSSSKWWPLKSISDADYEKELSERVIGLEAEMAMIDERITALKQEFPRSSDTP
ncbi:hypothetical protein PMZ80_001520 [Knufia obscura]|uniref:Uncharacterized protein n=2 Tax=Knufia TaxID=430999 RepID=A0AAN8IQ44_9EURO|nr:hypothetical protein PMZ80_001520 [Knufia obscura]KAK5955657.1 hypothetical protein OHC33_003298 [Knufia fluminis]